MTPTTDDVQKTLISLIAGNIQLFLMEQRRVRKNDKWFTGEEIATKLDLSNDLSMAFLHAFTQLSFDRLEIDDDMIRWAA